MPELGLLDCMGLGAGDMAHDIVGDCVGQMVEDEVRYRGDMWEIWGRFRGVGDCVGQMVEDEV